MDSRRGIQAGRLEAHGGLRGPREVDPVIRSESWLAWAVGPNGERAEGTGYPEQA